MLSNKRSFLTIIGLVTLIIIVVWLQFTGLAMYYQLRANFEIIRSRGLPHPVINSGDCLQDKPLTRETEVSLNRAADFLTRSVDINPRLSHSYLLLGRTLCSLGKLDQAIEAYQHYQMLRPGNPLGYMEEAFVRFHLCEETQYLDPTKSTLLSLNEKCENPAFLGTVEDVWVKAQVTPEDFRNAGDQALNIDEYQLAMNYFEWSIRLDPEAPDNWARLGAVCQRTSEVESSVCREFIEYNRGNWFVDQDLNVPNLSVLWKRYENGPGIHYQFLECPDLTGQTCASIVFGKTDRAVSGVGLYQCMTLEPGAAYKLSAWLRVNLTDEGQYRKLYVGGTIDGEPVGFWASKERSMGSLDWSYEEFSFTAPRFDGQACIHPIRLESQGEAWFHSPSLIKLSGP